MFNNKKAIVMYFKNYSNIKIALAMILPLGLFSCGSYQYASDNDGIYSSSEEVVYVEEVEQNTQADNSYYQNYFKEKRMEYDAMKEESEIFTDVDSYSSENFKEQDSLDNSYVGYGSWGADSNETVINVYNNDWYSPYWGYYGWNWNFYWGSWYYPYYGWGYPYYGYSWGYPYYGWGYPYYCSPYYGGGYYYGRNAVAINGRRGTSYLGYSGRNGYSSRNTLASTRGNALTRDYNNIRETTRTRSRTSISSPSRSVRTRSSLSTPRTTRSNNSSISTPSRTRSNNSYSAPSRTRSSSSSSRSISSPPRSSSSGSSSRSSGGRSGRGGR